jgi:esterase/lipase superfamily enzyme
MPAFPEEVMNKRHEKLYSKIMGRNMHVWCYGHWGAPILIFPSAAGFAHEWDLHGMVDALAPMLNNGRIKLYCPESNISQTWTSKHDHPAERAVRHRIYEQWILSELVPWIRGDCRSDSIPLGTAGCSMGGYYAAVLALKFPTISRYALCMSGRYKLTHFTGGYSNGDIYFNDPLAFVPNLDGEHLEHVRANTFVTLVCGQGMWEEGCIEETIALGRLLHGKGIPHETDIWGHDSRHDWDWWRRQTLYHFNKRYG